ncbi:MAG: PEP/pyruvate-binding domain-containing protein, partial [Desulfuromusa sp.]|nr:PEP/pyruvate-binding domain-containing protein [Desulfuromusa sp.]
MLMTSILSLDQISGGELVNFGGKTIALAKLSSLGYRLPRSLAIPCHFYQRYLHETGLGDRLTMELGRKVFSQMRWEELWDASLRIRNLFLMTPLSKKLETEISTALLNYFADHPLVIRSSAPEEDSNSCSFAGLHDSFVNIRTLEEQLLAIRKVWASLWSDRALLYRQELKLDVANSSMAVLVQELIAGEKSGVAFSVAPNASDLLTIEAVWGLNQGLVDGSVEPDCWSLDRQTLALRDYRRAEKHHKLMAQDGGLQKVSLSTVEQKQLVLTDTELSRVAKIALALEKEFDCPQDCEWTCHEGQFVLLQARPITSLQQKDPRGWYFNLHRSLDNLQSLQHRIEKEIIPGMEADAAKFASINLADLSDTELLADL